MDLAAELKRLEAELGAVTAGVRHAATTHDRLAARRRELVAELAHLAEELEACRRAVALLQALSNTSREKLCERLAAIVTTALRYVYGPDFGFEVELVGDRRGNTRLECYVTSAGGVRTRPQDARGGGVVDVVSIALRLGALSLLDNPPAPGPVILDEPGRHLDAEAAVRLGEFLRFMSEATGRQFIVVTHHEAVVPYAHAAYRITHNGRASTVDRIV